MKRKILIGLLIIVLLGVGAGAIIYFQPKTETTLSPTNSLTESAPSPTTSPKLLVWDDPAGFTFQYPEGLIVNKHDEDQDNYAHVEFTSPSYPGGVIVWAKDTKATNVTNWIKGEKSFTGANILDTSLGKQPAKKIMLTVSTDKKIIVGTIYDGLLFYVEGIQDGQDFWPKIHEQIVSSFVFKPIDNQAPLGNSDSGDDVVDEEEVIQ